jgi:GAF domain-containing protein
LEISRAIANAPIDAGELAEVAYLEASRLFETDLFQVGVFDSDTYRTLIWIRDGERLPDLSFNTASRQKGLVGWIRESRDPILVYDFEREADTLPAQPSYVSDDPPASGMFAPLCSSDDVLGVIAIQSRKVGAFSADDLANLEILAGALAPALRSSIIQAQLENLFAQRVLTQEITKQLTSLDPISDRVERMISLICQAFGYQSVNLYEHHAGAITLSASSTIERGARSEDDEIPEIVQLVLEQRTSLMSESESDEGDRSGGSAREVQMGIPLSVVDRLVGILHIQCHPGQPLPADQQAVLQMVGFQTAFALLEARNYEQHQEEAWITTVLLEVAKHAAEPGDPHRALEAVLQLAILLGGVNWAMLFLTHESGGRLTLGPAAGLKRIEVIQLAEIRVDPSSFKIELPIQESDEAQRIQLPDSIATILGEQECLSFVLSDGISLLGLMLVEDQPLTEPPSNLTEPCSLGYRCDVETGPGGQWGFL